MPTSVGFRPRSASNLALLLAAGAILGSAMPMLIILVGLAGLFLAPAPGLAALPASIQTPAGLAAAAPLSLSMGRRAGFVPGALMALGGGVAGLAGLLAHSVALLLVGHFALGAALAGFQLFRFAAAEVR